MIVEPFAGASVSDNLTPVGRIYYSFSSFLCVPHAVSEGADDALGNQAGEAPIARLVEQAGFGSFRRVADTVQHRLRGAAVSDTDCGPFGSTGASRWSPGRPRVWARGSRTLDAAGAEVVLTGRSADRLDRRRAQPGHRLIVPVTCADPGFRAALVEAVRDRHGRLDVLVNCAGTCDNGPLESKTLAEVTDVIELDLVAAIDLCRLAAPLLLARPGVSVINIASIFGQISSGGGDGRLSRGEGRTDHLHPPPGRAVGRTRRAGQRDGAGFFPTPLTGGLADPGQRDRICRARC